MADPRLIIGGETSRDGPLESSVICPDPSEKLCARVAGRVAVTVRWLRKEDERRRDGKRSAILGKD